MADEKEKKPKKKKPKKENATINNRRYFKDFEYVLSEEQVEEVMQEFIREQEFIPTEWFGQKCYRGQVPNMMGWPFVDWEYHDGKFHIEAWFGGTLDWESSLRTMMFYRLKEPYKKDLKDLYEKLRKLNKKQKKLNKAAEEQAAADQAAADQAESRNEEQSADQAESRNEEQAAVQTERRNEEQAE